MASAPYSTPKAPFRDPVLDAGARFTRPWEDFFRGVVTFLDSLNPLYVSKDSVNFPLSTSGYATEEWGQLTDNKVTLTPGYWMLTGLVLAHWTGTAPSWTYVKAVWSTANGANTGTQPTALTVQSGSNIFGSSVSTDGPHSLGSTVRVEVKTTTEVYLVPSAKFTTANSGYLKTFIYAERISKQIGRG